MKRSISMLVGSLLIAGALSIPAGGAFAQHAPPGINPTHYWTYKFLMPISVPIQIFASDQFYPDAMPLTVDRMDRLVNWVSKNGSPVLPDTFLHYTWWNLREKLPTPRAVRVINQFGANDVSVQQLDFMLVPAWKNQPQQGPPVANHYLCYRTFEVPAPPITVTLLDEWRQDVQQPQVMDFLCNPCLKAHGETIYPPVDTLTHLALYRISPNSDLFRPFIEDQFFTGEVPVRQTPIEYLLVPSQKIDVATPVRNSSWGRLKTIYR